MVSAFMESSVLGECGVDVERDGYSSGVLSTGTWSTVVVCVVNGPSLRVTRVLDSPTFIILYGIVVIVLLEHWYTVRVRRGALDL